MSVMPPPARPVLPVNGKELYDSLMSKIEPELVSAELPLLAQKYSNEPDDLKKERLARYAAAFKKYDEAYQIFLAGLRQVIKQYKTDSFSWAESISGEKEGHAMEQINTQISTQA